jgi:hypothetical protein
MAQDQELHRILVTLARILAVTAMAWCSVAVAQSPEYREELRVAVERIRYATNVAAGEADLAAGDLVAEFYERRSFLPAWREDAKIASLIAVIEDTFADGLEPGDYHLQAIASRIPWISLKFCLLPTGGIASASMRL